MAPVVLVAIGALGLVTTVLVAILVALLASLHVLLVCSTLVWHECFSRFGNRGLIASPRQPASSEQVPTESRCDRLGEQFGSRFADRGFSFRKAAGIRNPVPF